MGHPRRSVVPVSRLQILGLHRLAPGDAWARLCRPAPPEHDHRDHYAQCHQWSGRGVAGSAGSRACARITMQNRWTPFTGMTACWVVWVGQVLSLLGSNMTQFALTIWVYQQTGSAT